MNADTTIKKESSVNQLHPDTCWPHLVIQSTKGWGRLALHELWEYRELLWFLTLRDIKGRYRQMALGPFWLIIRRLAGKELLNAA